MTPSYGLLNSTLMVIISFEHCTVIWCMCGGCKMSSVLIWRVPELSNSGRTDGFVTWKLVGSSAKPGVCGETFGDDEGSGSDPAIGARGCGGVSSDGNGGCAVWLGSDVCPNNRLMVEDGVTEGSYCDEVDGVMNSGCGGGCGGRYPR